MYVKLRVPEKHAKPGEEFVIAHHQGFKKNGKEYSPFDKYDDDGIELTWNDIHIGSMGMYGMCGEDDSLPELPVIWKEEDDEDVMESIQEE